MNEIDITSFSDDIHVQKVVFEAGGHARDTEGRWPQLKNHEAALSALIKPVLALWPAEWEVYWDSSVENPTICTSYQGHHVWLGLRSGIPVVSVRHHDSPFTFPCHKLTGPLEKIIPEMRRWVRDREPRPFKYFY